MMEIHNTSSGQITPKTKDSDISRLDSSKLYPLTGPIYIDGAKVGDVLTIEVHDVKTIDWGTSVIIPGFGLLEEFTEPYIWHWDLTNPKRAKFKKGIKVPLRPFCGVMGVSPAESGSFEVMPPGTHGGNLDVKQLNAGSVLKLPILVEGGLFSAGDMHAAQGDGEVCVSAIETHGSIKVEFGLEKGSKIRWPQFSTNPEKPPQNGYFGATGIAPDLMTAAKEAIRNMIGLLQKGWKLTPQEAYVLCSVAADLRIHEVVDKPNWVVGAMISKEVLGMKD